MKDNKAKKMNQWASKPQRSFQYSSNFQTHGNFRAAVEGSYSILSFQRYDDTISLHKCNMCRSEYMEIVAQTNKSSTVIKQMSW